MQLSIEDATAKDLGVLYRIETQCFKAEAFTKRQIEDFLTDYNSINLVARENGEITGFIICSLAVQRRSFSGHIVTIDVIPDHRREGIAQRLLLKIEELLRKKGSNEIDLEVRENNSPAIQLYEKLGYHKIGVLKNYYGSTHGLYYRKSLT